MGRPADRRTTTADLVLERRWDAVHPLPRRWVLPDGVKLPGRPRPPGAGPLDFGGRMRALIADIAGRRPEFAHVRPGDLLVTFTPSRTRTRHGLQARVTPMRFRAGHTARRVRGVVYQVQRYVVDGRELLYLMTFCLPRFLDQPFAEKLVTVFHELYHIGTLFDGDLRRHPGRYTVHSRSKRDYDRHMAALAADYVRGHPAPDVYGFLRPGYAELWRAHGGITGVVVPRPKVVPVGPG